ncbi:hypothetical protein, partial [Agrobacterium sp. NPDC089420]|uniref:hypothetical protein n=1 Tax=Agrobacterium sp. NPDC089420 TaxID=3363918 RepID=UPI00384E7506
MTLAAFVLPLCSAAKLRYGTRRTAPAHPGAKPLRENAMTSYVLTVACKSTRGIVAAISGYLSEKGC